MPFGPDPTVTSETLSLGVIGWPVRHSLSPILQNVLLRELGIHACYHAFEIAPEVVTEAIHGAHTLGFLGLNVTVPHKEQALRQCSNLSREASILKAVNTLRFADRETYGHNTDPVGFASSIRSYGIDFEGQPVAILGAGGAARSVVLACARMGASEIRVLNRTPQRADKLAKDLAPDLKPTIVRTFALVASEINRALTDVALVVNATTLGMWPETDASPLPEGTQLPANAAVYDLIYNPMETKFLWQARCQGLIAHGGLDMLIYQALASIETWFQRELPEWEKLAGSVRSVLENQLREGSESRRERK